MFTLTKDDEIMDIEFEFETELIFGEIMSMLQNIEDSHIMCQTLKPIDEYTGE